MHVTVRRYEGVTDARETVRRVEEGFLPITSSVPGFVAYYVIDAGGGVLASISLFESRDGAEESTRRAAEWVKDNLTSLLPNPPQVTSGEVVVSRTG